MKTKLENPLQFSISEKKEDCFILFNNDEKVSLYPGAMFGGKHYGFSIQSAYKDKIDTYETQCRINAAEMVEGILKVYEEGKTNPWAFDINGNLIKHATFNERSRRDILFLRKQIGTFSEEEKPKVLQKINSYRKDS